VGFYKKTERELLCVCVSAIKLLKAKDQKGILFYNSEIITIPSTFQNPKDTNMGL